MLYSRVIRLLKIALPLVALVLMTTVFLVATPVDPSRAIELAEIDVLDRAQDPRLTQASYAGVTEDNNLLEVTAETARSDPDARLRFNAENLTMSLVSQDGNQMTGESLLGFIDRGVGDFVMVDQVRLETSDGTVMDAPLIWGLLDSTLIEAPEGLFAVGPIGEISAPFGRITQNPQEQGGLVMVFTGGVRLLYTPEDDTNPEANE